MSQPVRVECGQCNGHGHYDVVPSTYTFSGCLDDQHADCVGEIIEREDGMVVTITRCYCDCHRG